MTETQEYEIHIQEPMSIEKVMKKFERKFSNFFFLVCVYVFIREFDLTVIMHSNISLFSPKFL